jgi:DNA mismatch endonuclease (patch repair protein)
MAKVRSRDTGPELAMRRALHAAGLRYRLHSRDVPGHPDIVFRSRRIALFIHGCFWHRHPGCKATRVPKSGISFWLGKFEENMARDRKVEASLVTAGWNVIVVWECEVLNPALVADVVAQIRHAPQFSRRR